jgi:hypothetical protein
MRARLRAVCEFCERTSRWVDEDPMNPGHVRLSSIGLGWTVAPYSVTTEHANGTHGDQWACPPCGRRMERGVVLTARPVECTQRRARTAE